VTIHTIRGKKIGAGVTGPLKRKTEEIAEYHRQDRGSGPRCERYQKTSSGKKHRGPPHAQKYPERVQLPQGSLPSDESGKEKMVQDQAIKGLYKGSGGEIDLGRCVPPPHSIVELRGNKEKSDRERHDRLDQQGRQNAPGAGRRRRRQR